MTLYALTDNKGAIVQYPYDLRELRKSVSLPKNPSADILAEHRIITIEPSEPPIIDHTQNITEDKPRRSRNTYRQSWTVTPATPKEIEERTATEALAIRAKRNQLLDSTGWTQLPDAPVDRAAWAAYRQQLRDLPSQPGFPWAVQWPNEP